MYIYIFGIYGIHFELRFYNSISKVGPSAYRPHALTTELSGRTMRCA